MKLHAALFVSWLVGYLVIGSISAPPAHALEACTNQVILPFPTGDPHPLRPNPGQVCTPNIPADARLSCGTDLVVYKTIEVDRGGPDCTPTDPVVGPYRGGATCEGEFTETVPIEIGLQNLELPIAGVASNTAVSDTISDSLKMRNYSSWYLQGATEQADEELLDVTKPETLDRMLNFSGFIKKTISEDVLNERRKQLITLADQGQTYNQIIGYVKNNEVIGRKDALELFSQNPGRGDVEKVRLSHVADYLNAHSSEVPPYVEGDADAMKWYTLWRQVPWTQTVDLAGEVFATVGSSDQSIFEVAPPSLTFTGLSLADLRVGLPHLAEDDQLAQLMQSVIIPSGVDRTDPNHTDATIVTGNAPGAGYDLSSVNRENPWPWSRSYCRPENLQTPWNPGDNLGSTTTIRGNFRFTKRIQYSYNALTPEEEATYVATGILPKVEVEMSAPVSIFTRTPQQLHDLYDRLVGGPGSIYKALVPAMPTPVPIEDWPTAAGMTFACGTPGNDDCEARAGNEAGRTPHLFFPHLGSILTNFHQKIQCMLDPLGRCGGGGDQFTTIQCTIPLAPGSCGSVNWNDNYFNAYEKAYNSDTNDSWTLVKEPWAQDLIYGTSSWTCPRFVAALWLEESGGSAVGKNDLGCTTYIDASDPRNPPLPSNQRGGPANFSSYAEFEGHYRPILEDQIQCLKSFVDAIGDDFRTFMCQYRGMPDIDPNKPYRQCYIFMGSNFPKNLCEIGAQIDVGIPVPPP